MATDGGTMAAASPSDGGAGAFAFFSLVGDRFDAPGMPADTAREVGYFRDAVLQMARQIYLERNPDRKRVPAGFDEAFDLRLTTVERGSARPQLLLHRPRRRPVVDAQWDEWTDIYASARDQITAALDVVDRQSVVPQGLSKGTRSALKRVGSSLDTAERIEVGHPTDKQQRANLDESTRRVLAEIEQILPPTPVAHELVGIIVEYDGSALSFSLRTEHGLSTCVLERFNDQLATRARDVLALDGVTAPDVSVVGETLDTERKNVHLYNVSRIDFVRSIEEKALVSRMNHLTQLEPGWWGPDSEPPAAEVLSRLELVLDRLAAVGLPVDLIPSPDGAVVVEWRRGAWEYSATLTVGGRMVLIADNTETDELGEAEADFEPAILIEFLERGSLP